MRYITSIERMAEQRGLEQGIEQALRETIVETLQVRFGDLPATLADRLAQVQQVERLRALFRRALNADSLATFEAILSQMLTGSALGMSDHDNASTTAR